MRYKIVSSLSLEWSLSFEHITDVIFKLHLDHTPPLDTSTPKKPDRSRTHSSSAELDTSFGTETFNINEPINKRVQDQPILTLLEKLEGTERATLIKQASVMGGISLPGSPTTFGGACLVDGNKVVTNLHCVLGSTLEIAFTDYSSSTPVTHRYKAVPSTDSDLAKKLGIHATDEGDVCLLDLIDKSKDDFPTTPITLASRPEAPPKTIRHLGFYHGSLHVSEASSRTLLAVDAVKRGWPLLGRHLSWSDYQTHGEVTEETFNQDGSRSLVIQSKSQTHHFRVGVDGAVKSFRTRETTMDLKVELQILTASDHVILGLKAGEASSGGSCWFLSEHGWSYYAMLCGEAPQHLFPSDLDHEFKNHLAVFLDQPPITPFILDSISLESKPIPLKDIRTPDPRLLNLKIITKNPALPDFGYIKSMEIVNTGTFYGLSINTHDSDRNPLAIISVNLTTNRVKYDLNGVVTRATLSDFNLPPDILVNDHYTYIPSSSCTTQKVSGVWQKKDDGHCIMGIKPEASALPHYSGSDLTMLKAFEEAMATHEFSIQDMTNGTRNKPLLQDSTDPILSQIIGHTGISVPNHKEASASDVKIYLGPKHRAVYTLFERRLTYNRSLSLEASH